MRCPCQGQATGNVLRGSKFFRLAQPWGYSHSRDSIQPTDCCCSSRQGGIFVYICVASKPHLWRLYSIWNHPPNPKFKVWASLCS